MLEVGQKGHAGAVAGMPGELRGDQAAVVGSVSDLCAGVTHEAEEAVTPDLTTVKGSGGVHLPLTAVEAAKQAGDFGGALRLRPLGHLVDEAARGCLPVQDRTGPFQDLYTLQLEGIELARERVEAHTVAVDAEGLCGKSADLEPVKALLHAVLVGLNAWRVAQGFIEGEYAPGFHLTLADDRNRLRHLQQEGVGLRAGVGSVRDEAVIRADADHIGGRTYGDLKFNRSGRGG